MAKHPDARAISPARETRSPPLPGVLAAGSGPAAGTTPPSRPKRGLTGWIRSRYALSWGCLLLAGCLAQLLFALSRRIHHLNSFPHFLTIPHEVDRLRSASRQ